MADAFRHRQVGDVLARLKDDPAPGPPRRPGPLGVLAQDPGLARVAPAVALQDLHRGGLAGPVRAEQREHLPSGHFQVQAVQGDGALVGLAQPLGLDHEFARHPYSMAPTAAAAHQPGVPVRDNMSPPAGRFDIWVSSHDEHGARSGPCQGPLCIVGEARGEPIGVAS